MLKKLTELTLYSYTKNEAQIHDLSYLFWESTKRCNLNCLHCGSNCTFESNVPDMPFEDFMTAIQPIKTKYQTEKITIVISGGEPLLRADLADCGKKIRENGFRWSIVTNGYLYDNETHAKLLSAGMGAITVSLDGFEESHNWLRNNPNSFQKAINAIDIIANTDRLNFDVATCVNPKNIDELHYLADFLISKNVKSWRLFTIAPIGRAANHDQLELSPSQLKKLMNTIAELRTDNEIDIKFSCEAYVGPFETMVRDSFFFCRAGINIASILADGSISGCPNINNHFIQGNIYKDNFLDVWENKFQIMRNRKWTKKGKCRNCADYKKCKGGAMHLWDEKQDSILTCINKQIEQTI